MPELPEVEVLVRHLRPLLRNRTISSVEVWRARVVRPISIRTLKRVLCGAKIQALTRRGKYLLFEVKPRGHPGNRMLIGHLGMTGRMYLLPAGSPLPKHVAVVLGLGEEQFVFEDPRYFGRLTLDRSAVVSLGPEPLSEEFCLAGFRIGLARSTQSIKVKLLDQSLVAGVGNIYASEALFRAGISPRTQARRLSAESTERLLVAIRETLASAIELGSSVPLNYAGVEQASRFFYYGRESDGLEQPEERFRVYDREGRPCIQCGSPIRRIVQAARSTFYCPKCQRGQ